MKCCGCELYENEGENSICEKRMRVSALVPICLYLTLHVDLGAFLLVVT